MQTVGHWLAQVAASAGLTPADLDAAVKERASSNSNPSSTPSTDRQTLGPPIDWAWDGPFIGPNEEPRGFDCLTCRDARFVRRDVPVGHPDFGRAFPCRCTRDDPRVRAAQYAQRRAVSGLPAALAGCTLDTLRPVAGLEDARNAIREAVDRQVHGGDPLWVVLYGPPGCGKTHLLAAAVNALLPRQQVTYWAVPELLQACKAAAYIDGEHRAFAEDQQLTATAQRAEVLILDEFGGPSVERDWAWAKLDLIVKARYTRRAPLLLGMTCTPQELQTTAPAIASRLRDPSLVRAVLIKAPDYRPRLAPTARAS